MILKWFVWSVVERDRKQLRGVREVFMYAERAWRANYANCPRDAVSEELEAFIVVKVRGT
jgi:hypothetical protein